MLPGHGSHTRHRPARSRGFKPQAEPPAERRRPRAHGFCLTERDLELLGFIATQRFVLARHVEAWLQASEVVAYRRLRGLVRSGLVVYERFFDRRPGCYRVTGSGLAVIESPLPRPIIDLRFYRHDLGAVLVVAGCPPPQTGAGRASVV